MEVPQKGKSANKGIFSAVYPKISHNIDISIQMKNPFHALTHFQRECTKDKPIKHLPNLMKRENFV
jgi:hypothetical protein